MGTLTQKVDVELKDARVGWGVEGVKNANPSSESASKMRTLRQKVGFGTPKTRTLRQKVRQKHVPLGKKSAITTSGTGQRHGGAKHLAVPASSL